MYPDVKAIVSGFFNPLDETRCLVCGAELHGSRVVERTCGKRCFTKMCQIQRQFTEADCDRLIAHAKATNDPQLAD